MMVGLPNGFLQSFFLYQGLLHIYSTIEESKKKSAPELQLRCGFSYKIVLQNYFNEVVVY